jgi:small-conductance mechanosensitive channel
MKKRIESLQQEAGKVPALQQQVDKLKQQLESQPLETPAPKNQPVEEKPAGFTVEDPQPDLISEMKLNDELSGELDAQEGRRDLVSMGNFFLNTITP